MKRNKHSMFLMRGENDAPMPEGSEENTIQSTLMENGEWNFGSITFTNPGIYIYKIEEQNSTKNESELERYIVTITVKESDGKLVAEQTITDS